MRDAFMSLRKTSQRNLQEPARLIHALLSAPERRDIRHLSFFDVWMLQRRLQEKMLGVERAASQEGGGGVILSTRRDTSWEASADVKFLINSRRLEA